MLLPLDSLILSNLQWTSVSAWSVWPFHLLWILWSQPSTRLFSVHLSAIHGLNPIAVYDHSLCSLALVVCHILFKQLKPLTKFPLVGFLHLFETDYWGQNLISLLFHVVLQKLKVIAQMKVASNLEPQQRRMITLSDLWVLYIHEVLYVQAHVMLYSDVSLFSV